ncbi:MAG: hypothetical protein E7319_00740 [Clostridiales bacterium]|nr:hypothetical protein [Clostridiales bacterium]
MRRYLALILVLALCLAGTTAAQAASDPFPGMRWYDSGMYKVGVDMLPGEYVLLATSEYGGYYCVSDSVDTSDIDSIIFNDTFDTNRIITVERGDYVELKRCLAVDSSDFYEEYTIKLSNEGVMLRVGYDVMPGTYRLKTTGKYSGYYAIYNTTRMESVGDIVKNDNFDNQAYITLSYGQYVILNRCVIDK